MKSFTAHIIYRIVCEEVVSEQYEEQWRILFANDETTALAEAQRFGKEEECSFIDRHGRTTKWKMVAIKEIREVNMKHGALVLSRVKEVEPIADPVWISSATQ
ncbi:MAG TPA: DUF4288 domain-containing protein [Flavipsychrobacter sp.]|nr:DUF4288 domain-containing protein [Flavipsychrobacter sp.]